MHKCRMFSYNYHTVTLILDNSNVTVHVCGDSNTIRIIFLSIPVSFVSFDKL